MKTKGTADTKAKGKPTKSTTVNMEPPPEEDKPPTKPAEAAYSRAKAIVDALRAAKTGTLKEISAAANALYIKNGGKDNLRETEFAAGTVFRTLAAVGLLKFGEKAGHPYTYLGK